MRIRPVQITALVIALTACGPLELRTPANAMDQFDQFKQKEKFVEDKQIFYPGMADPMLRPILTEKINDAADDLR